MLADSPPVVVEAAMAPTPCRAAGTRGSLRPVNHPSFTLQGPNQELAFLRAMRGPVPGLHWEAPDLTDSIVKAWAVRLTYGGGSPHEAQTNQPPARLGAACSRRGTGWCFQEDGGFGPPTPAPPSFQELQERAEKGLREMLGQLLRRTTSTGHVVGPPGHLAYWLQTSCPATRSRAASLSSCLLHFAGRLPSFKVQDSAALGNLLVQLAVSLVDPDTGIRAQARGTLGQLHRLLQCRRGLRKKTRAPRWEANPGQPWKEGYLHLRLVGEKQKEAFAQAAWGNVSHLAQDWVREGSLVLLYSVLGQARQLLEEEEEDDLRMSLSALLYKLWKGREAPSEIQALLPKTDVCPILDRQHK
uniref:Uncharacterized protein n=1 Tax=Sphaerodactylus townsendi TaxID=933632 RepID=A0ACB8EUA9_9SAUR